MTSEELLAYYSEQDFPADSVENLNLLKKVYAGTAFQNPNAEAINSFLSHLNNLKVWVDALVSKGVTNPDYANVQTVCSNISNNITNLQVSLSNFLIHGNHLSGVLFSNTNLVYSLSSLLSFIPTYISLKKAVEDEDVSDQTIILQLLGSLLSDTDAMLLVTDIDGIITETNPPISGDTYLSLLYRIYALDEESVDSEIDGFGYNDFVAGLTILNNKITSCKGLLDNQRTSDQNYFNEYIQYIKKSALYFQVMGVYGKNQTLTGLLNFLLVEEAKNDLL